MAAAWATSVTIDASKQFPWFALQAWSGREGSAAHFLKCRGYEVFYPRYVERRQWSDRIKTAEVALFSGYLFCRFDPENCTKIVSTPGVLRIVSAGRQPISVDENEIDSLRVLVNSFQFLQPWPYLHVGQRVAIRSGPLCGAEGVIIRIKGRLKLVVSINILQRSVAVELGSEVVAPIGSIFPSVHAHCV